MQLINDMQKKVQGFAAENATTLLTAGGVVGVVATGVLAGRGGMKANQILAEMNAKKKEEWRQGPGEQAAVVVDMPKDMLSKTDKATVYGLQFAPAAIAGTTTIVAVIMSHRMSANKAAALAAAYGLSQKQFEEYKTKISEKLTGPKQDAVREELAQERANRAEGADNFVIIEGGDVLCFDEPTGRYFKSSMEKMNRAVNKTNEKIINEGHVDANFFYDCLGLPPTVWGEVVGFTLDKKCDIVVNAILSPEDEKTPVLSFDFRVNPVADYAKSFR